MGAGGGSTNLLFGGMGGVVFLVVLICFLVQRKKPTSPSTYGEGRLHHSPNLSFFFILAEYFENHSKS
jgi:hypothetical protein